MKITSGLRTISTLVVSIGTLLSCRIPAAAATISVVNTNDKGAGSLRQAIMDSAPGDEIEFSVTGTITLTSGELIINTNLTITGPGATNLTLSGNHASRIFNISAGNVAITGLTIVNGSVYYPSMGGGGILNHSVLSISNCTLLGNTAVGFDTNNAFGGAVFNCGLLIIGQSILSNNAACSGSGIFNDVAGFLIVNQSTFVSNRLAFAGSGGAIYNAGNVIITTSVVFGNGGRFLRFGTDTYGGGIFNYGTLTASSNTLAGNSAFMGGGIFNNGPAYIVGCSLLTNGGGEGGGLYNGAGVSLFATNSLAVSNCNVAGNTALCGGGIANRGTISVINTAVSNNLAGYGGGIWNFGGGALEVTNSTVSSNMATLGGGVFNESGSATVSSSTVSGNSATSDGGGLSNMDGGLNVERNTITRNSADRGGGISCGVGTYIKDSIIAGNTLLPGGIAPDCFGSPHSQDYNLIQNTNGSRILFPPAHDIYGEDPKLGPLQDNGGPTWTHGLIFGSPAIDAGRSDGLATDQRGHPRVVDFPTVPNAAGGDGSDIGAFEVDNLITGIENIGADVRVKFITASNETYRTEYSPVLPATNWILLPQIVAGTGGFQYVTNFGAASQQKRFYRVRQN